MFSQQCGFLPEVWLLCLWWDLHAVSVPGLRSRPGPPLWDSNPRPSGSTKRCRPPPSLWDQCYLTWEIVTTGTSSGRRRSLDVVRNTRMTRVRNHMQVCRNHMQVCRLRCREAHSKECMGQFLSFLNSSSRFWFICISETWFIIRILFLCIYLGGRFSLLGNNVWSWGWLGHCGRVLLWPRWQHQKMLYLVI